MEKYAQRYTQKIYKRQIMKKSNYSQNERLKSVVSIYLCSLANCRVTLFILNMRVVVIYYEHFTKVMKQGCKHICYFATLLLETSLNV